MSIVLKLCVDGDVKEEFNVGEAASTEQCYLDLVYSTIKKEEGSLIKAFNLGLTEGVFMWIDVYINGEEYGRIELGEVKPNHCITKFIFILYKSLNRIKSQIASFELSNFSQELGLYE
jgi:hypothetical protein